MSNSKRILVKSIAFDILRYALSVLMIPYAVGKLMGVQFTVIPFSAWQLPLEQVQPFQLAWAFLGYTQWFQITLGVFEFIPCVLLFFRRTALMGAVLMLPMAISVALINYSLDLSSYTKTIILVILSINLVLLALCHDVLAKAVRSLIVKHGTYKTSNILKSLLSLLLLIACCVYYAKTSFFTRDMEDSLTGHWTEKRPYEWNLIDESYGGSVLEPRKLKMYFMPHNAYTEINDSSHNVRFIEYDIDKNKKLIRFHYQRWPEYKSDTYIMRDSAYYEMQSDSVLKLIRYEKGSKHLYVFRRRIINETK